MRIPVELVLTESRWESIGWPENTRVDHTVTIRDTHLSVDMLGEQVSRAWLSGEIRIHGVPISPNAKITAIIEIEDN